MGNGPVTPENEYEGGINYLNNRGGDNAMRNAALSTSYFGMQDRARQFGNPEFDTSVFERSIAPFRNFSTSDLDISGLVPERNYLPSTIDDLAVATQSSWRNWRNNLYNEMDQLDIMELKGRGERKYKSKIQELNEKKEREEEWTTRDKRDYFDAVDSLVELSKQIKENQEDIKDSPVARSWQAKLERANALGAADWFTNEQAMQLSQDLAGSLNYMLPMLGGTLAAQGVRYLGHTVSAFSGGASGLAGEVLGGLIETATVLKFREKETDAEIGGAMEEAMLKWERDYLKQNPQVSQEQYEADRLKAERNFRNQIPGLYNKNMSLAAGDIIMNRFLLGINKIKLPINTPSIVSQNTRGLIRYGVTNTLGQYLSEGVGEEGRQSYWQKQFVEGKIGDTRTDSFGQATSNFLRDVTNSWTGDLTDVSRAWLGTWADEETKSLAFDDDFHDAVSRGGFAAMAFGGPGLILNTSSRMYTNAKVRKSIAESLQGINPSESVKQEAIFQALVNDALYSYAAKGDVARDAAIDAVRKAGKETGREEQVNEAIEDMESKFRMYDQVTSFFPNIDLSTRTITPGAGFSKYLNSRRKFSWKGGGQYRDQMLHQLAWEHASKSVDLERLGKKKVEYLRDQISRLSESELIADKKENDKAIAALEKQISLTEKDTEGRVRYHRDKFHRLIRGQYRKNEVGDIINRLDQLDKKVNEINNDKGLSASERKAKLDPINAQREALSKDIDFVRKFDNAERYGTKTEIEGALKNGELYKALLAAENDSQVMDVFSRAMNLDTPVADELIDLMDLAIQQAESKLSSEITAVNGKLARKEAELNKFLADAQAGIKDPFSTELDNIQDAIDDLKKQKESLLAPIREMQKMASNVKERPSYDYYIHAKSSPVNSLSSPESGEVTVRVRNSNGFEGLFKIDKERTAVPKRIEGKEARGEQESQDETLQRKKDEIERKKQEELEKTQPVQEVKEEVPAAEEAELMLKALDASFQDDNHHYAMQALNSQLSPAINLLREIDSNNNFSSVLALEEAISELENVKNRIKSLRNNYKVLVKQSFAIDAIIDTLKTGLKNKETQVKENALSNEARNTRAKDNLNASLGFVLNKSESSLEQNLEKLFSLMNGPKEIREAAVKEINDQIQSIVQSDKNLKVVAGTMDSGPYTFKFNSLLLSKLLIRPNLTPEIWKTVESSDFDYIEIKKAIQENKKEAKNLPNKIVTTMNNMAKISQLELVSSLIGSQEAADAGKKIFESMSSLQSTNESAIVPNFQQAITLMQLMSWYDGKEDKAGMYVSGYAGSGKTTTVMMGVELIQKYFGLKPEEVMITAANERIRNKLASKAKENKSLPYEEIKEDSLEGIKLLVVDEAAFLKPKEISDTIKTAEKLGIKVILLGDPNQLSSNGDIINPLESNIRLGSSLFTYKPLTIVSRTDITPLREFQNRYIGSTSKINTSAVIGQYSTSYEGVMSGNIEQAAGHMHMIQQYGMETVVIADSKDHKMLQKAFEDIEGVIYLEPAEAQGSEFDAVFIYLPEPDLGDNNAETGYNPVATNYNRQMYVASTRAKKLAFKVTATLGNNELVAKVRNSQDKEFFSNNKKMYSEFTELLDKVNSQIKVKSRPAQKETGTTETSSSSSGTTSTTETTKVNELDPTVTGDTNIDGSLFDQDPEIEEALSTPEASTSPVPPIENKVIVSELNRQHAKKDTKGAFRVQFPRWKTIKQMVTSASKELAGGTEVDYVAVAKKSKKGDYMIEIEIMKDGRKLGNYNYIADKAETQKLVKTNPDYNELNNTLNEIIDEIGVEQIIEKGSVTLGTGTVKKINLKGAIAGQDPAIVDKTFVDKVVRDIRREVIRNNPDGTVIESPTVEIITHIIGARESKTSDANQLLNKIPNLKKAPIENQEFIIDTLYGNSMGLGNYSLDEGKQYMVIIHEVQKPSGKPVFDLSIIELYSPKVTPDHYYVQRLKTATDLIFSLNERLKKRYPKLLAESTNLNSFYTAVYEDVVEDDNLSDEDKRTLLQDILATNQELSLIHKHLKVLAKNNPMLRKYNSSLDIFELNTVADQIATDLNEIRKIATSFENGESNYLPAYLKELWESRSPKRGVGLHVPINKPQKISQYWLSNGEPGIVLGNKNRPETRRELKFQTRQTGIVGTNLWVTFKKNISDSPTAVPPTEPNPKPAPELKPRSAKGSKRAPRKKPRKFVPGEGRPAMSAVITQEQVLNLAQQYFGRELSKDEITFLRRSADRQLMENDAWGYYDGMSTVIATTKQGNVFLELAKHELFHKIFNELLTTEEKKRAFKMLQVEESGWEKAPARVMEERLGDLFMVFEAEPETFVSRLKNLFKRILRMLNIIVSEKQDIKDFFQDLSTGVYANSTPATRQKMNPKYYKPLLRALKSSDNAAATYEDITRLLAEAFEQTFLEPYSSYLYIPGDINNVFKRALDNAIGEALEDVNEALALDMTIEELKDSDEHYELGLRLESHYALNILTGKLENKEIGNLNVFSKILGELTGLTLKVKQKMIVVNETANTESLEEINEESKEEGPEETTDSAIAQVVGESDFQNIEQTSTYVIKTMLSAVRNEDGELLNPRQAFRIMMDLFSTFSNETETLKQFLDRNLKVYRNKNKVAVLNVLSDILRNSEKESQIETTVTRIRPDGEQIFIATSGDAISDLKTSSIVELTINPKIETRTRKKGQSSADFIAGVIEDGVLNEKEQLEGLEPNWKENLVKAYHAKASKLFLNTVVSTVSSMYYKNLHVLYVNTGNTDIAVDYNYVSADDSNPARTIRSELEKMDPKKVISKKHINELKRPNKNKGEGIEDALKLLAKEYLGRNISKIDIDSRQKRQVANLLDKFVSQNKKDKKKAEYVSRIARILINNDPQNTQAGALSKDGKTKWQYNKGVAVTHLLKNLSILKGDYWWSNPVLNANANPRFLTHHETINTATNENTGLTEEYKSDYYTRQVGAHFRRSATGRTVGWFYTISDKGKTHGIEIDSFEVGQIEAQIEAALLQELMTKDLEFKRQTMRSVKNEMIDSYENSKDVRPFKFAMRRVKGENLPIYAYHLKGKELAKTVKQVKAYLDSEVERMMRDMEMNGFDLTEDQMAFSETNPEQYGLDPNKNYSDKEIKKALLTHFGYNNYMARHWVNQIAVGNLHNFKSYNDMIKRIAGAFAPGLMPMIEKNMQETVENQITPSNLINTVNTQDIPFMHLEVNDITGKYKNIYGQQFDRDDAQEFRTFEYHQRLQEAFGTAITIGLIDKPVYYSVAQNGEVTYMKTAAQTLTPLLNKISHKARRLSEAMTKKGIENLIPNSGIKLGRNEPVDTRTESLDKLRTNIQSSLTGLKQQLEVESIPNKNKNSIVIPSQLLYLIMNNTKVNAENAYEVYAKLGELYKANRSEFERNLYDKEGNVNVKGVANVIRSLTNNDEINGIIADLINDPEVGTQALNLAGISSKSIEILLGEAYKKISQVKFKGMKGTLVADTIMEVFDVTDSEGNKHVALFETGTDNASKLNYVLSDDLKKKYLKIYVPFIEENPSREHALKLMKSLERQGVKKEEVRNILVEYYTSPAWGKTTWNLTDADFDAIVEFYGEEFIPRDLDYSNSQGYTEIVVPSVYKNHLEAGQIVDMDFLTGIGFRLPSTDLHSEIIFKVVGFYHEGNDTTNTVFAPKEIVAMHGSDFDADALYLIFKEAYLDSNTLQVNNEIKYSKGDIPGLNNESSELLKVYNQLVDTGDLIKANKVMKVAQIALRNEIVIKMMEIGLDPNNLEERHTPLSFDPIFKETSKEHLLELKSKMEEDFNAVINDPSLTTFEKLDAYHGNDKNNYNVRETNNNPNSIIDDIQFQADNNDGQKMVGVFANGGKSIYLLVNPEDPSNPLNHMLNEPINILGATSDRFKPNEVYPDGKEGMKTTHLLDILINASTDAVKAQVLNAINANTITGNAYIIMTRSGVPFIYQTAFMRSRAMREYVKGVLSSRAEKQTSIKLYNGELEIEPNTNESDVKAQIILFLQDKAGSIEANPTIENAMASIQTNPSSAQDYATDLAIINEFLKMEGKDSKLQRELVAATALMNKKPRDMQTIQRWLNAFSKITNTKIEQIPHIYQVKQTLARLENLIKNSFAYQSERVNEVTTALFRDQKIFDRDQKENMLKEFEQFTLTYAYPEVVEQSYKEYTGTEAVTQEFVDEIERLKKQYPENEFLNKIQIVKSRKERLSKYSNLYDITIYTKELTPKDRIVAQASLYELDEIESGFVNRLVRHFILTKGLSFGYTSITPLLEIESLKEVTSKLSEITSLLLASPEVILNEFLRQYYHLNTPRLSSSSNKIVAQTGIASFPRSLPVVIINRRLLIQAKRYAENKWIALYSKPVYVTNNERIISPNIYEYKKDEAIQALGITDPIEAIRTRKILRYNPNFEHYSKIEEAEKSDSEKIIGVYSNTSRNDEKYYKKGKDGKLQEIPITPEFVESVKESIEKQLDEQAQTRKLKQERPDENLKTKCSLL